MQIGAHLSSAGGIDKAVDRAVEVGAESLQVFTQSPRTWRPTNHDPASFERFREKRTEAGLEGVVCHALYLCNLAAPDDGIYEKSVAAYVQSLRDADLVLLPAEARAIDVDHRRRVMIAGASPPFMKSSITGKRIGRASSRGRHCSSALV